VCAARASVFYLKVALGFRINSLLSRRFMMVYGRHDLTWKGRELRLTSGRLLATIEPDGRWAGMFRVRLRDGWLSDMVNLSWAKDAAVGLSLDRLNRHQETGSKGVYVAANGRAVRQGVKNAQAS
jgi:hypothetical protein